MQEFTQIVDNGFIWNRENEQIWAQAWGKNAIRIRVSREKDFRPGFDGLLDNPDTPKASVELTDKEIKLVNGDCTLTVGIRRHEPQLTFSRSSDNEILLQERHRTTAEHSARTFTPDGDGWHVEQRFFADDKEKFYGLGQRQHGYLDQKGCVMDTMHRNSEVSIPFMVSNKGYGFLWHHPGLGQVALGRNDTRWTAKLTHQIDYWVVIDDSPAAILERYAEVTGKPSTFPEWGAGFWQCKLRYKTQKETLEVAREYHRRGLPVSVMVIDFHHWVHSGDWAFDPELWPDPKAMVEELKSMGMKCMVSIWPTVNEKSPNFAYMKNHGLFLRNERGNPFQNGMNLESFYDATNPAATDYMWEQVRKNYVEHGIRYFWLDTIEPEIIPLEFDNTRYYLGHGNEVTGLYPRYHQKAFYDGLKAEGEEAPMTLGRSAWVGSQRYGAAIWSADIPSTFDSLRRQISGGLNIAMSGIPWWTTDIGGFHGGDIDDPSFRELIVRWFQYGVFCPIMRLHGVRRQSKPKDDRVGKADPNHPSVANEVWSYGEEVCEILSELIHMRERLKDYIMTQMKAAEETGLPPMRPVFVDYYQDKKAWNIEDQYMFGPDILVAPVTEEGQRSRAVYLPEGNTWHDVWSGKEIEGGSCIEADAPLEQIPLYVKNKDLATVITGNSAG